MSQLSNTQKGFPKRTKKELDILKSMRNHYLSLLQIGLNGFKTENERKEFYKLKETLQRLLTSEELRTIINDEKLIVRNYQKEHPKLKRNSRLN